MAAGFGRETNIKVVKSSFFWLCSGVLFTEAAGSEKSSCMVGPMRAMAVATSISGIEPAISEIASLKIRLLVPLPILAIRSRYGTDSTILPCLLLRYNEGGVLQP